MGHLWGLLRQRLLPKLGFLRWTDENIVWWDVTFFLSVAKAHCLLRLHQIIPTYGHRLPSTNTWIIPVRGWIYTIDRNSVRKRILKSLSKRIFVRTLSGSADANTSLEYLDKRLDMYLTRSEECFVDVSVDGGPVDPGKEDLHPHEIRRDGLAGAVEMSLPPMVDAVVESKVAAIEIAAPRAVGVPPLPPRAGAPPLPPRSVRPESDAELSMSSVPSASPPLTMMSILEDENVFGNGSVSNELPENEATDETEAEIPSTPEISEPIQQTGLQGQFRTDANGHFTGSFVLPDSVVQSWRSSPAVRRAHGHLHTRMTATRSGQSYESFGTIEILEDSGISVISDVDDTIKHSNITSGASAMLANALVEAAQDIPGMSQAYNTIWRAGASFHYVSAAPWQVFPTVVELLRRFHFPPGSFHMRTIFLNDPSIRNAFEPSNRGKMKSIHRILQHFPNRKFILVGDSGEDDMFTYAYFKKVYPGQILAIFIRDVDGLSLTEAGRWKLSAEALARFEFAPPEAPDPPPTVLWDKSSADARLPRLKSDPLVDPVIMLESRLRFAFAGFDSRMWGLFTDGAALLENKIVRETIGLD